MAVTVQDYEAKKIVYTTMAGMMADIAVMSTAGWSLATVSVLALTVWYKKDITV